MFDKNNKAILNLTTISLFVSFTVVCSQISIPLPFTPIPMNLALISVFMSGYVLGSAKGTISQFIYVLLVCVGVPVFANFHGGIGIVVGPKGGYTIGYIATSFIIGLFVKSKRGFTIIGLSMIAGLLACYCLGMLWFMISTKTNIFKAVLIYIIPFFIGDILKIALSIFFSKRLKTIYSEKFNNFTHQ